MRKSTSEETKSSASKKRKRKNIKVPSEIFQNESLEITASSMGPIRHMPLATIDKEILLQRLKIELLDKYSYSVKKSSVLKDTIGDEQTNGFEIVRQCVVVGMNECTRALQKFYDSRGRSSSSGEDELIPSLLILSRDVRPPTILAHFPFMCKQMNIPIAVLPGKASIDVGSTFNIKVASVILFMKYNQEKQSVLISSENETIKAINSFIEFAKKKIPTLEANHRDK